MDTVRASATVVTALTLAGALVVATVSAQTDLELQRTIERGGATWSSPKSQKSLFGPVAEADQLWIWPVTDAVMTLSHRDPRLTLNWRWRRERAARPTGTLASHVIAVTQQGRMTSVLNSDGSLTGIDADLDAGTCEMVLSEFERQFSGDANGTINLFVGYSTGLATVALSNVLRVQVHLVEGTLDYRVDGSGDTWLSRELPLASPGVNVQFSPDGSSIAVTTEDGRVDLWDVASGSLRSRSAFKIGRAGNLRFNSAGDRLVLWDPSERRVVLAHGGTLQPDHDIALPGDRLPADIQFVPASTRVAVRLAERKRIDRGFSIRENRGVLLWDWMARAAMTTLGAGAGDPTTLNVTFSADGLQMVSWNGDDIWLWSLTAPAPPRRVALGHVVPADIEFVDDGELIVMTESALAFRWDLATAERRPQWSFAPVRSVHLRWPLLAASDGNRGVSIWDARTGTRQGEPLTDHPDGVPDLVLSGDGRTLAAGSSRSLVVWDVAAHQALTRCTIDGPALPLEQWELAISASGSALAVTRHDRKAVLLWTRPNRMTPE